MNIFEINKKNQEFNKKLRLEYELNPTLCLSCNKPLSFEQRTRQKFCSLKCSAKYNKDSRSENREFLCKYCGNTFEDKRKTISGKKAFRDVCTACKYKYHNEKIIPILDQSLNDLYSKAKNWQAARASISYTARMVYMRSSKPRICFVCKYDKHVQISHIKPVSEFDKSTLVKDVNHINNLVALCPNHHWEFDHGKLNIFNDPNYNADTQIYSNRNYNKKDLIINRCPKCNKEISTTSKMCEKCSNEAKRIVKDRPNKEYLLKLIEEHGYEGVGRIYSVSGKTIKKWSLKLE